ncbi:hypothetical protein [Sphingomonas mesophila]|uniref:hypothetical protein n=1 Tax=Sphingomonas mesophila TaxID=2303576 RepID=UPI000E596D84|nr:hypothetical protein [Sphingomonas mesophila]
MEREDRLTTLAARAALMAVAALLAWHLMPFGVSAVRAILYPHELDYGEGIVWYQATQLFDGSAYGPIDRFPSVVFHYTPLFHFVSGLIAVTGVDGLAAGRLVSALSTLAVMVAIGAIVAGVIRRAGGAKRVAALCGAIGGLALLIAFPVKIWAPLMRVDMLAFALALIGILAAIRALERPRWIVAAALLFVAAVYTKQTMVAAPAAVFAVMLVHRPRTAWAGIALCVAVGAIVLAALTWTTGGGFARHVFLYNVNRFDLARTEQIWIIASSHIFLIGAALIGVAAAWPAVRRFAAQRRDAETDDAALVMLLLYLVLTSLMLLLVLKLGSSANYFVEWLCAVAIFAGLAARCTVERALEPSSAGDASLLGKLALVLIGVQAVLIDHNPYSKRWFDAREAGLQKLAAMIRSAPGPVISDDMVAVMRAGRPVLWEPAIFTELAATGAYDERPFVRMIEQRKFALFIIYQGRGETVFSPRFSPAVASAIERNYRRDEIVANLTIHRPR